MFSVRQKRFVAYQVQKLLRDMKRQNHPELPEEEIPFILHVKGVEEWSWAEIRNNGAVPFPSVSPHNEEKDNGRTDS